MAGHPNRSYIVGTAVAGVLLGALAIAVHSGASLTGSLTSGTGSPSTPATSPGPSTGEATDPRGAPANDHSGGIPVRAFAATVTYVHDGDTLFLEIANTELKVRLIGIDTPELASTQRPDASECYGEESRELLRDFLPEGTEVWAIGDREPEDRYGRSLLYVFLHDGTFVNLAMIELGAAHALEVGINDQFWPELRSAEAEASAAQLGMWARC
jgi:micrococcal nuclease